MPRFQKHIFVCTNNRPDNPKSCCYPKGGLVVQEAIKRRLEELNLRGKVRANKAGCLDACRYGVSMVIYPQNIW